MDNYNNIVTDDQKFIGCPYNKSHQVTRYKFANHLEKCRRSYNGPELSTCRFNILHIFDPSEIVEHEKNCRDRLQIEKCMFAAPKRKKSEERHEGDEGEKESPKRAKVEVRDEWEEEFEEESKSEISFTDRRKLVEKNPRMIMHYQHTTKSERKKQRIERHNQIEKLKRERN